RSIARLATEQLVHRNAQRLAFQVPERGVDAADRAQQDRPAAPEGALVHVLPDVFELEWIAANDELAQVFVRAEHAVIVTTEASLADAGDAFVGFDFHDVDEVPIGQSGWIDLQIGDLHRLIDPVRRVFRAGADRGRRATRHQAG